MRRVHFHRMNEQSFPIELYRRAVEYYEKQWRTMDDVLYRLCRDHPQHNSRSSVSAKLWIIGRTYASGIERKVLSKKTQGSSMSQIANHLVHQALKIDALLSSLHGLSEPLDSGKLGTIVEIHGRLVDALRPITRKRQSTRSFVSKYLHFHNPVVPIYDSVAKQALRGLVPWKCRLAIPPSGDADSEYAGFVARFFALYEAARLAGLPANVRHLDHLLLTMVDSSYAEPTSG